MCDVCKRNYFYIFLYIAGLSNYTDFIKIILELTKKQTECYYVEQTRTMVLQQNWFLFVITYSHVCRSVKQLYVYLFMFSPILQECIPHLFHFQPIGGINYDCDKSHIIFTSWHIKVNVVIMETDGYWRQCRVSFPNKLVGNIFIGIFNETDFPINTITLTSWTKSRD